jgi:tetratricopeptide (TPR) repeat protein
VSLAAAFTLAHALHLLPSAAAAPLVMNPGTFLYDCNNPLAAGSTVAYPTVVNDLASQEAGESDYQHAVYRDLARRISGRDLSSSEANRYWATKAVAFIRDQPLRFIERTALRSWLVFHQYRWHDVRAAFAADRALGERGGVPVPFAAVSALAVLGLATGLTRWRELLVPYGIFVNQFLLQSFSYASDRQRVSIAALFALFAAIGAARLLLLRRRMLLPVLAAVGVLAAVFSVETDLMRDVRHTWEGFDRAQVLRDKAGAALQRGDLAEAVGAAAGALALCPWAADSIRIPGLPADVPQLARVALKQLPALRGDTASARFDRAMLLLQAGDPDGAAPILESLDRDDRRFERLDGRVGLPSYHLAWIERRRGHNVAAGAQSARAITFAPGDPAVLAQRAAFEGDKAAAARIFRYFDDADAHYALGIALFDDGRPVEAAAHFRRLVEIVPAYRKGNLYLAAALAEAGRDAEAAAILYRGPPPTILETPILTSLGRTADAPGAGCEARRRYARALETYGRYGEAIRIARSAGCDPEPALDAWMTRLQDLAERVAQDDRL